MATRPGHLPAVTGGAQRIQAERRAVATRPDQLPVATGGTHRNQAERRAMATQPKTPRPKALKMLLVPLR